MHRSFLTVWRKAADSDRGVVPDTAKCRANPRIGGHLEGRSASGVENGVGNHVPTLFAVHACGTHIIRATIQSPDHYRVA